MFLPRLVWVIWFVAAVTATAGLKDHMPLRDSQTINKRLVLPSNGGNMALEVDNINGSVHVEAYGGDEVLLTATKKIYCRNDSAFERAQKEVSLEIFEVNGVLVFYVDSPSRDDQRGRYRPGYLVSYDFELKVPEKLDLTLKTVNEGDIHIYGVEGSFFVRNVNGSVSLHDVAGHGLAKTVNGPVSISFRDMPDKDWNIATINGEVSLLFDGVPDADFEMKTFNGKLMTDFDYTPLQPRAVQKSQENGYTLYKVGGSSRIRVGAGGPQMHLETLNGNVVIRGRR